MSNPLNQEEQFNSAVAQLERGQDFDNALSLLDESSLGQVKPLLEIVVAAQKLPFFTLPAERSKILAAALTTKLVNTPPVIGPLGEATLIAPITLDAHRLRRNIWGPKVASALAAVALLVLVFGGLFWLAQQAPEQLGGTPSPAVTSNPLVPTVNLTETSSPATTSPVNTWGNKTPTAGTETIQTTVKAAYNTYTPKPATTGNGAVPSTVTSGATTTTSARETTTSITVNTTKNTTVSTTQPATPTLTQEIRPTTGTTTTVAPTTTVDTTTAPPATPTTLVQPTPTPGQTTDTPEPSKTPKTPSPTPAPTTDNSGKGGGGGNKTPEPTKTNGGGGHGGN